MKSVYRIGGGWRSSLRAARAGKEVQVCRLHTLLRTHSVASLAETSCLGHHLIIGELLRGPDCETRLGGRDTKKDELAFWRCAQHHQRRKLCGVGGLRGEQLAP